MNKTWIWGNKGCQGSLSQQIEKPEPRIWSSFVSTLLWKHKAIYCSWEWAHLLSTKWMHCHFPPVSGQHRGSSSPGDLLGLIKAAATLSRNSRKYTADDSPSYKAGSTVLDSGPWRSCSLPGWPWAAHLTSLGLTLWFDKEPAIWKGEKDKHIEPEMGAKGIM